MEMPKPLPAHAKLARFVGTWEIAETMHPSPWDPKGSEAQGRSESRLVCDGFFVATDYEQLRDGEVTFRGHGVYGFDAKAQKYTMHWFDSMGMDPGAPAPGEWIDDTLTFQHATGQGHARYTYVFEGPDRFTFRIENSSDGEDWVAFLDSVYTRVE
jgi:hypothetical protein